MKIVRSIKGWLYFSATDKSCLRRVVPLPSFERRGNRCRIKDTKTHRLILSSAGYFVKEETPPWQNPFLNCPEWQWLSSKLRPYQLEGVAFFERTKKALLGDEQGLGKTVQALGWLFLRPDISPVIIICPASLKDNWKREVHKWVKERAEILEGKTPYKPKADILIINYDILSDWKKVLQKLKPMCFILDECQHIKNRKAGKTKAVRFLVRRSPYLFCLSGTPIKNRPAEFFNVLNLIAPTEFPNFLLFAKRYCKAKLRNGMWWDFTGASNTKELHARINGKYMLRRLKQNVLQDLPPKQVIMVPISLTPKDKEKYERLLEGKKDLDNWIEELRQHCLASKLPAICEWIEDFLEGGKKLPIMVHHHSAVDYLRSHFKDRCEVLDGRTKNKQAAADRFQEDPACRLLIGNIQSAGTGFTLTAASDMAFIELPWTPADMVQGEDRVHRFTQKKAVCIYYLLAPDTIEESMWKLLQKKRKIMEDVLDGRRMSGNISLEVTTKELAGLLWKTKNK